MNDSFLIIYNKIYSSLFIQQYDNNGNKVGNSKEIFKIENNYIDYRGIQIIDTDKILIMWSCNDGLFGQYFNKEGQKIGDYFEMIRMPSNNLQKIDIKKFNDKQLILHLSNLDDNYNKVVGIYIYDYDKNKSTLIVDSCNSYYKGELMLINDDCFFIFWDGYGQLFSIEGQKLFSKFLFDNDGRNFRSIKLNDNKIILSWFEKFENGNISVFFKWIYDNPVKHELLGFEIFYPQTDETIEFRQPNFKWKSSYNGHKNFPWDVTYNLYISNTEDFTDPLIYQEIQDTTFQMPDTLEKGQIYYWKVQAMNWEYDSLWSSNVKGFFVSYDAEVGTDEEESILSEFSLSQNYPNPFNPTTTIGFEIPFSTNVEIAVYSLTGKKIKTLTNSIYTTGFYNITWDGTDNFGTQVSSGIYYYKMATDLIVISKKMILMK